MNIQNEVKLAAEQLSRTKCPDCGGYHKVEINYFPQNGWLVDNLNTIACGKFNAWASKRIRILAESINLERNNISPW